MLYRENGQFKATYVEDQQILPIVQDRWFMLALLAIAYLPIPAIATDYLFRSLIVPFLILAIAAIGLNILVGYCGQISLGTAAFMAIGAYAAYNIVVRIPLLNFLIVLVLAGAIAALVGVLFGIPSLRIKGLYLAVATLAAQFFVDWMFARVKWFTNYSPSGSVSTPPIEMFGWTMESPLDREYLFVLTVAVVLTLGAKNLVRGHIGRSWDRRPARTWTSPPRSSASGRCTQSFPRSRSARSTRASRAPSGGLSALAPGSRWRSMSTCR